MCTKARIAGGTNRMVAAIDERRLAVFDGLDTATAYDMGNRWAQRRGSLIRQ
jgi:hypothetical protein